MRLLTDIAYQRDATSLQTLDLYLPDTTDFPTFVHFHGGGLEYGDKKKMRQTGEYLASHGIAFATANYRLYPTAAYPEFLRDAAGAVAWVNSHISEYGGKKSLYVGGDSAGAYLSMMLCFDKRWLAPHRIDPATLAGFIHDAGQPTKHYNILRECGEDPRSIVVDETAPLYHVGKATAYAPMLFLVSEDDMENRYEQTMLMISTLKHFKYDLSNVELDVLPGKHCAIVTQCDRDGNNALGIRVEQFIRKTEGKQNTKILPRELGNAP